MLEMNAENNISSQGIQAKKDYNSSTKLKDILNDKVSIKESKHLNSDKKENFSDKEILSDSDSEEKSDTVSVDSNQCKCDHDHGDDFDHHNLNKPIKKKQPDSMFYEKQILVKNENEKKYEKIRKRIEEEAKNRAKPVINEESKKIMEKKQGFVKPIYQRAKEIEEAKKNKIVTLKKNIDDRKAKKEEDDLVKSKFVHKNKHFNEKEFAEWRINTLEWENKKKKKIDDQKEQNKKHQLDTMSKFYHPIIDKRSENLVNKSIKSKENISVFDKLYNNNEEKQKKLLQKAIDSLPDFKPNINKNVPNYIKTKPQVNNSIYSNDYKTENITKPIKNQNHKYNNSINLSTYKSLRITINEDYSRNIYNTVSVNSQIGKSKRTNRLSSIDETYTNPMILSDSDEEKDQHDEVVSNYKKALEQTNPNDYNNKNINNYKNNVVETNTQNETHNNSLLSKNTYLKTTDSKITVNKVIANSSNQYSSEKNKEKIELYNQKIAALLISLKKSDKKKY